MTALEARWPAIRQGIGSVTGVPGETSRVPPNITGSALHLQRDNWKTFGLLSTGQRVDELRHLSAHRTGGQRDLACAPPCFPIVSRTITSSPQGDSRAVVRAHLGLIIAEEIRKSSGSASTLDPAGMKARCLFDDSYELVRNDTRGELRAVLFRLIDRPMDKVGTAVNKLLFSLIKASPYVKQPLKIWPTGAAPRQKE